MAQRGGALVGDRTLRIGEERARPLGPAGRSVRRETQPEKRSAGRGMLQPDRSAVTLRDLADDREAKSGAWHAARRRRSPEPIKHVLGIRRRYARPMIADDDIAARRRHVDARTGELHFAALTRSFDGGGELAKWAQRRTRDEIAKGEREQHAAGLGALPALEI